MGTSTKMQSKVKIKKNSPKVCESVGSVPSAPNNARPDRGHVWTTLKDVFAERTSCAWLIRRFIDPRATFRFVAQDSELPRSPKAWAFGFGQGTLLKLVERYNLARPGFEKLSKIVYAGCNEDGCTEAPEGWGLAGILSGLHQLDQSDTEIIETMIPVYDALLAHCAEVETKSNTK